MPNTNQLFDWGGVVAVSAALGAGVKALLDWLLRKDQFRASVEDAERKELVQRNTDLFAELRTSHRAMQEALDNTRTKLAETQTELLDTMRKLAAAEAKALVLREQLDFYELRLREYERPARAVAERVAAAVAEDATKTEPLPVVVRPPRQRRIVDNG